MDFDGKVKAKNFVACNEEIYIINESPFILPGFLLKHDLKSLIQRKEKMKNSFFVKKKRISKWQIIFFNFVKIAFF